MDKIKDFKQEFYRIINLIETKNSFVFVRYGDGEVMLMNNQDVNENTQAFKIDKWKSKGETKLGNDLKISIKNKEWFYGIPCDCCNLNCKNYLLSLLEIPEEQITYANLLINSNYNLFLEWVKKIENVVLMVNKNAANNLDKFPFKIDEFFPISDNCVDFYEKNYEVFISQIEKLALKYNNKLFLISAGPLSEVIIHYMYQKNKNNKYIDVGSSLDEFTHNKITRPYMIKGNTYNLKKCIF